MNGETVSAGWQVIAFPAYEDGFAMPGTYTTRSGAAVMARAMRRRFGNECTFIVVERREWASA